MTFIRLEPHHAFRHAIISTRKDGLISYGYDELIEVCMNHYQLDYDDAAEWVDYNIIGLQCHNPPQPPNFKIIYPREG